MQNETDDVLKLTAQRTTVSNLSINGKHEVHGISLGAADYFLIDNVTFTDCIRGINVDNVDDSIFSSCSFLNCNMGVWLQHYSDDNEFRSCQFIDCSVGWYINTGRYASRDNILIDCEFKGNTYRGITIEGAGSGTIFRGCDIEGNALGVDLDQCGDTTFIGCSISDNTGDGIYMDGAEGLLVQDSHISSNGATGISVSESSNVIVKGSNVDLNVYGIWLYDGVDNATLSNLTMDGTRQIVIGISECTDVSIDGCLINGSSWSTGVAITGHSQRIWISDTSFVNGSSNGIHIMSSGNITVKSCSFLNNRVHGIRGQSVSDLLVASCTFESCRSSGLTSSGRSIRVMDVEVHNSSQGIVLDWSKGVEGGQFLR